ncbi:T9SS type B sorting domain-containing protein [Aquimarina sp. MMG015]|uniref:T9SS type B sorting domain-containing protein n=1 Tax=Aquimarina sp. MMG015 TaxID=2822689 RepID=UPI001B3A07D4|nr:T9SS type B sorting domain-containing protein [Aquimarina sp. MMG015]MBQ4805614.1 T9SS type B sorting domain-containing protein [Aquimarina sp. MMG015]
MVKKLHFTLLLFILCFNGYAQNEPTDCINSIIVCGNTNLELNSNGVGTNDFALPGNFPPDCAFVESQSLWIKVNIVQSGTLAFTITPESSSTGEDYDFAVYGPNVTCNALGTSIRCSSTNPPAAGVSTLTGLNDTETETSEGPGSEGNGFVRSIDALAGEEYYILIDNYSQNGGFDLEFTGTALLPDSPQNDSGTSTSLDLTECDIVTDPNDGMTNFDLESNTAAILGTQINTIITYHASEEDASLGNGALTSPYLSTQNNQTIYVRIENTITECFVVDTFLLITDPGPPIAIPTPFIVCDTNDDGNDTNGFVSFLLSNKDSEILNGLNPTDYTLTYHLSQSDADAGTNIIDKTTPYINISNPQTLFVRVQENTSLLCLSTTSFELQVDPLPVANASTLTQCDEYNNPTDGITLFNLNQSIDQITNGNPNRTVTFFEDLTAANMGAPSITNTDAYQNSTTNQQLFVRVTDDTNNCFRIITLDLQVSITTANNASIAACDDDGIEDGFTEFDLTLANAQVLFGINNPNLSVVYYQNIDDALSETNLITSYTNTTTGTQGTDIVYARIEDNLNQCYGINQVALFVNPLPDIEESAEAFLCEGSNVTINSGLQSGTSNNFDYLWSPNGETTESISVSQEGTYTVSITNQITGCSKDRIVSVTSSSPATIIQPIEINDALDNNTVAINVSGSGDYEYAIAFNDANIRTYQDSPIFTDVPPGFHTVYVRDKNGCGPEASQAISVVGFPKYFTPNGDGFHETWNVGGISSQVLGNSIIYIFDRSGKLLKQLVPSGNGWDGTYGGTLMPSSEYWYRVELSDGRVRKGSFSLIR